jgi:hypothetical protein
MDGSNEFQESSKEYAEKLFEETEVFDAGLINNENSLSQDGSHPLVEFNKNKDSIDWRNVPNVVSKVKK